jgi:single-strand DNA-binding protein
MARSKSTTTAAEASKAEEPTQQESITIVGRLCADPVLRRTKTSCKAVTTLRVAVNPPEGDASFHNVVAWERTAEVVCEYLRKGRPVEVVGRAQQRTYTAADGSERQVDEIIARRVTFISAKALAPADTENEVA